MVAKFIKVLKYLVMSGALLYAAYTLFKTGDVAGAVEYVKQWFTLGL